MPGIFFTEDIGLFCVLIPKLSQLSNYYRVKLTDSNGRKPLKHPESYYPEIKQIGRPVGLDSYSFEYGDTATAALRV